MRKLLLDELPVFDPEEGEIITKDFKFELITPMFGGDSKSWELNLEAPVRAQSVKGQLRFWWRAMQNETDYSKLLKLENALWGGKSGKDSDGNDIRRKSKLSLEVRQQKILGSETAKLKGKMLDDGAIPAYVAFPVRDAVNDGQEVKYITKASFVLRVSFHKDYEEMVLKILKLWTLFGGVGARTRRGCGSLYCEELLRDFKDAADIKEFIEMKRDASPLDYCRLAGATLAVEEIGSGRETASEVWKKWNSSYRGFRQSRSFERIDNKPKFGRSYWPEPDAIRRLTDVKSTLHAPIHPDGVWFPRAAFGLPIITQFNQHGNGRGDPADVELVPSDGSRWPSPVIIKVVKLSSCTLKIVLVLNQNFPGELKLKYSKELENLPNIKAIPVSAHPENYSGKIMRTNEPLNGKTVYEGLFEALGVSVI